MNTGGALAGLRVLDFSTLLPGPLAGLMLAEAGAEVTKIERPGTGDEMRGYPPQVGGESALFALLHRGKKSVALDLKQPGALDRLQPLLAGADVLIEQFRPGVMERLGLGYEQLRERCPRLVYCSITGFGQAGPRAQLAGHDLNYLALTGLLHLACGRDGAPALPPTPIADIAGGSYPALANILLALLARERTGRGCRLDISMTDSLFTLAYWALAQGLATGDWPRPGQGLVTGGSPRYQLYACADGRWLAAAPIEERFWQRFCALVGLAPALRVASAEPAQVTRELARIVAGEPGAHWERLFAGEDVCCCIVRELREALEDPHFLARELLARRVVLPDGTRLPALPLPIAAALRAPDIERSAPALGQDASRGTRSHQGEPR
jgi:crotonobetainyl-CoA:carnitine CoA-transferase CaiB-like acyl-CoA transferase